MEEIYKFKLLASHLPIREQNVLKSIFNLIEKRSFRQYMLVDDVYISQADIVIIDSNSKGFQQYWKKIKNINKSIIPILFVNKGKRAKGLTQFVQRPITISKVISTLEKTTINNFQFVPEIVISDNKLAEVDIKKFNTEPKNKSHQDSKFLYNALVIDDSSVVRELMSIQLKLHGIKPVFASSGEEALELLEINKFDMVFLDVGLPGIDGYDVCKKIKSKFRNVPVCMLTGKGSKMNRLKGLMRGCDAYLVKPVSSGELKAIFKQFMNIQDSSS